MATVEYLDSEVVVLVVWDEPSGLEVIRQLLTPHSFHVLMARSGVIAVRTVEVYRQLQVEIDLVLLNRTPDGPATFETLRAINPALRCAFMSATGPEWDAEMMRNGAVGCI